MHDFANLQQEHEKHSERLKLGLGQLSLIIALFHCFAIFMLLVSLSVLSSGVGILPKSIALIFSWQLALFFLIRPDWSDTPIPNARSMIFAVLSLLVAFKVPTLMNEPYHASLQKEFSFLVTDADRVLKDELDINFYASPFLATSLSVLVINLFQRLNATRQVEEQYRLSKKIEPGKLPALEKAINDLESVAVKLGLPFVRPEFRLEQSTTALMPFATVQSVDGQNSYILLPRAFVFILQSRPDTAKAILAHEISHIIHQDVRLWGKSDLLSNHYSRIALPLMIPLTLIAIILPFALAQEFRQLNLGLLIGITAYKQRDVRDELVAFRVNSEWLADEYASELAGPDAVATALQLTSEAQSEVHPDVQNRLELMELRASNQLQL